MKVLIGHHDLATAFVHGGTRYWIDSHPHRGQRLCVLGPHAKKPRHASYSAVVVMYVDDNGKVCSEHLHPGKQTPEIDAFEKRFADAMNDQACAAAIKRLRFLRTSVRVTFGETTLIGARTDDQTGADR